MRGDTCQCPRHSRPAGREGCPAPSKFGQVWPEPDQIWPKVDKCLLRLAGFGHGCAEFDQIGTQLDRIWTKIDQMCADLDQVLASPSQILLVADRMILTDANTYNERQCELTYTRVLLDGAMHSGLPVTHERVGVCKV